MKISHFSIKHPTIITIILIALLVFAIYLFRDIPVEFLNDINEPSIRVVTIYPGASASDVESDVTKILEDNFVTLNNYKSMESQSNNSFSLINITFLDNVDPYDQLPEIRYRVSQLMDNLPNNIQGEPMVFVGGANMLPVITLTIEGGKDINKLTQYAENQLKPLINHIEGVSNVYVLNGEYLEVKVKLRINDVASKNINISTIYQLLIASNIKLAIGDVSYQEKSVDLRYEGNYQNLEDIKSLAVGFKDNTIIRLSDVADISIEKSNKDYYIDNLNSSLLLIQITKRLDGNVVNISKELKEILELQKKENSNITFDIISDDSKTTIVAIKAVLFSGLLGLFMAIFIIFVFIRDNRATIIITLSIPISILLTIIEMRIFNISLNVLSITGLVIALGMIVDGSIVMIEQVYKYYQKRNRSLNNNILLAADEVGPAIFGSVMTSIVVYLPLLFLNGLIGQIMFDTSIVLIFALSSSFLVAVIVVPFLMSKILKEESDIHKIKLSEIIMEKLTTFYKFTLSWCLKYYKFIFITAVSFLLISLYAITILGFTFVPSVDTGNFDIYLKYPQGYDLETTKLKTLDAIKIIEKNLPEAKSIIIFTGDNGNLLGEHPSNWARVNIILTDANKREKSVHQIMLEIQESLLKNMYDCEVSINNGGIDKLLAFATSGGDYGITLISEDLDLLYKEAKRIEKEIQSDDSVVSTSLNSDFDSSSLVLNMNHQYLYPLGINSNEAGLTSLILFNEVKAGSYQNEDGKLYDIKLESDLKDQALNEDTLLKMQMINPKGEPIYFTSFSNLEIKNELSSINHDNRIRALSINAKLVSEDTAQITNHINKYLKENPLNPNVQSKPGGLLELITDAINPLIYAISIAIFLVFSVMVIQFENFRHPLIIMATIPFCIIGVALSLLFFQTAMSLISMLGFFALSGLVVNNGIILIDHINQQRNNPINKNTNLNILIIDKSASRLRAILMTTLSTMFGVIPMAIAKGVGSELYAPLGQAIAGGLITSTLISLFLIPTIYYVIETRVIQRINKKSILNNKKETIL